MGIFLGAASLGPTRAMLNKLFLPQPGEGPTKKQREKGCFEMILVGKHPEDYRLDIRARVTGDRDPGYGATCRMLGESAVCLALDGERLTVAGGFWTPASAMGDLLLKRMRNNAGMTFETMD
jgi:short subunit dehydrogenase-like uncharacterized protein